MKMLRHLDLPRIMIDSGDGRADASVAQVRRQQADAAAQVDDRPVHPTVHGVINRIARNLPPDVRPE
jgi:hypothetical protein